ncbi:MAG: hypothetical protein ACI3YM_02785 [Prevotella sp.]
MSPIKIPLSTSCYRMTRICLLTMVLLCVNALAVTATTVAELQAQNELLQVRSKVNFLPSVWSSV